MSLADDLRITEFGWPEVSVILRSAFAYVTPMGDRELHLGDGKTADLIVKFNSKGNFSTIEKGPTFKALEFSAIVQAVNCALATDHGSAISRRIMFCGFPIEGYFRYTDKFQIIPPPPEAPRLQFVGGQHATILETSYQKSNDVTINTMRRAYAEQEIAVVLGALLWPSAFAESYYSRHEWVIGGNAPEFESEFRQLGYQWPGANFAADSFSNVEEWHPLNSMPTGAYYSQLGARPDSKLHVPSDIVAMLDAYFALPSNDASRFRLACYWYQQGMLIQEKSHSAGFVALINGIEALLPSESRKACSECGQMTGPSISDRFVAFLGQYAQLGGDARVLKQLYSLRSSITHGSKLFSLDSGAMSRELRPGFGERLNIMQMTHIVQIALVNWLAASVQSPA